MTETIRRSDLLTAAAAGQAAFVAGAEFTACPYRPDGSKGDRLRSAAWLQAYRRAEAGALTAGGTTMTAAAPEVEAPPEDAAPAPDENGEVRWPFHGSMITEGIKTGDGRKFTNLSWVETPFTFRAQFSEEPGHDGAVAVGRIETVTRTGDRILYTGSWDDESLNPQAAEARRFNRNGQMRGVSIDADQGTVSFEDADGNPLTGDDLWEVGPEDEVVMAIDGARIRALTACMIPAFIEAYVLDDTLPEDAAPAESVTAATGPTGAGLTAAAILAEPETHGDAAPASAFAYPGPEVLAYEDGSPRGLTVTDDGRVYGYAATWGTCHIGISGQCVTPPHSATNYGHFAKGEYRTRDGESVAVGPITMDTGHAPIDLSAGPAAAHYDNTGTAAAWVAAGEDEVGIWFAGVVDEDLPLAGRRKLQRCGAVSGDWRYQGAGLEAIAFLAVNVPGFPIPKVQSRVASGRPTALVASGVVTHDTPVTREDLPGLIAAGIRRHERQTAVEARLRRARARRLVRTIRDTRGS